MTKYIIDAVTGTILDMASCYIVDAELMGDDLMLTDSEAGELANEHGISVAQMARDTGFGDNAYRYTVSYSPLSIKDEAEALLDGVIYEDDEIEKKALTWARETATPDELRSVSDFIMGQDSVWDGFRENLIEALVWIYKENNK